jgi:flagellar biosynthesis protein FliQ
MNEGDIITVGVNAMTLAAKVSAPILAVSLVVGIIVSLLQTIFSVQDQTLSMVPRLAAGGLVLLLCGHWMLASVVDFTTNLFNSIPQIVNSG